MALSWGGGGPWGAGAPVPWAFARRPFTRISSEGFVESLGVLYSREEDPAAVFRAYRAGFIRRLRREISPHADLAEEKLLERLAHDRSLSADTRRWLVEGAAPKTRGELVIAVRAIESYPRLG